MLSTRNQLLGMSFSIAKNLKRLGISKTVNTGKLTWRFYSVKVNVEGTTVPPVERKVYEPPENFTQGTSTSPHPHQEKGTFTKIRTKHPDSDNALLGKLKALTKIAVRDPEKIESICNELHDKNPQFNLKENIDLLYCLSVLNIHNEKLAMRALNVITCLLDEIERPSPLITCISKSMRNLLLRNTGTLNGIMKWFLKSSKNIDMSEAADFIQTLAVLNYFPPKADELIQRVMKIDMMECSSSMTYLNFVWALALVDRVEPEMAVSVLEPSFRKKLESILGPGIRNNVYLKLVNINAYANMRNFQIEIDSKWLNAEPIWVNRLKQKMRKDANTRSLIDCLANMLPFKCFNTFVDTTNGCVIDAVCFFDYDHRPITELEFVKNKGGIKLAIMVLSYKDLCFPGKNTPTGIIEFHKRCLTAAGYKVLCIPFNECPTQGNLRNKLTYLKKQINTVLPRYGEN